MCSELRSGFHFTFSQVFFIFIPPCVFGKWLALVKKHFFFIQVIHSNSSLLTDSKIPG